MSQKFTVTLRIDYLRTAISSATVPTLFIGFWVHSDPGCAIRLLSHFCWAKPSTFLIKTENEQFPEARIEVMTLSASEFQV